MNKFGVGMTVEHILSRDWMLVLDIDKENGQILCRTKTHETIWFAEWELNIKM